MVGREAGREGGREGETRSVKTSSRSTPLTPESLWPGGGGGSGGGGGWWRWGEEEEVFFVTERPKEARIYPVG